MQIKIFQVDAFTDKLFTGNPAAVCILPESKDEKWMQSLAMEMNLSETAFLLKLEDEYELRWFTPATEVELCGHATLASAHILWETDYLKLDEKAIFHTRSGILSAEKKGEWIEMDFPSETEEEIPSYPPNLIEALNVEPNYAGKNRFDYLVEVDSEKTVREINPDLKLLKEIPARGFIITSLSDSEEYDFISRFFAPRAGFDEDPVTGSAHCCLGPYWKKRLNKDELLAYQASERGGVVRVKVNGERVYLGGQAVTVFEGRLV